MFGANKMAIWIITGLMAVLTVFFNMYIFLMNMRSYEQNKHWSPCETIITALSVANVAHQLLIYFWMTMDELDRACKLPQMYYSIILQGIYSLKFTIMWTTAFLTFYYSTKLVSRPNQCYSKIQAAILKHVTLVVLLIPICGFGTHMPMLTAVHIHNDTTENKDCGVIMPDTTISVVSDILNLILSDILPGLVVVKCCISISAHLAIHLQHMKATTNGSHGPKLGAEMRVIHMNLTLVLVFLCYLVVDLYMHYQVAVKHDNVLVLAFFVSSVFTTVNAIVLIYGKKTFWKALLHKYNFYLDEFHCLSCLKVPEAKPKQPSSTPKVKQ